jgi:hypothetical protein
MPKAPAQKFLDDGLERAPGWGQSIQAVRAPVRHLLHDPVELKLLQPSRELTRRDAVRTPLEIAEPAIGHQKIADDEERPSFTDGLKGAGDQTEVRVATRCHAVDRSRG